MVSGQDRGSEAGLGGGRQSVCDFYPALCRRLRVPEPLSLTVWDCVECLIIVELGEFEFTRVMWKRREK
jgi:hypothetical protein